MKDLNVSERPAFGSGAPKAKGSIRFLAPLIVVVNF